MNAIKKVIDEFFIIYVNKWYNQRCTEPKSKCIKNVFFQNDEKVSHRNVFENEQSNKMK